MLAQRLHRLIGTPPVPRDLHSPGPGARPALEPDRANRAGPELHAEAGHHRPRTGSAPGESRAMSLSLQRFGLDMSAAPGPARIPLPRNGMRAHGRRFAPIVPRKEGTVNHARNTSVRGHA